MKDLKSILSGGVKDKRLAAAALFVEFLTLVMVSLLVMKYQGPIGGEMVSLVNKLQGGNVISDAYGIFDIYNALINDIRHLLFYLFLGFALLSSLSFSLVSYSFKKKNLLKILRRDYILSFFYLPVLIILLFFIDADIVLKLNMFKSISAALIVWFYIYLTLISNDVKIDWKNRTLLVKRLFNYKFFLTFLFGLVLSAGAFYILYLSLVGGIFFTAIAIAILLVISYIFKLLLIGVSNYLNQYT